jgi:hypothetical protein
VEAVRARGKELQRRGVEEKKGTMLFLVALVHIPGRLGLSWVAQ